MATSALNAPQFHNQDAAFSNVEARLWPICSVRAHCQTDDVTHTSIGWNFSSHEIVNHSAKEYIRGYPQTITIEGYFSNLSSGIYRTFQHVSGAHLKIHVAEFDFRYNYFIKLSFDDVGGSNSTIVRTKGRKIAYQPTCHRGSEQHALA